MEMKALESDLKTPANPCNGLDSSTSTIPERITRSKNKPESSPSDSGKENTPSLTLNDANKNVVLRRPKRSRKVSKFLSSPYGNGLIASTPAIPEKRTRKNSKSEEDLCADETQVPLSECTDEILNRLSSTPLKDVLEDEENLDFSLTETNKEFHQLQEELISASSSSKHSNSSRCQKKVTMKQKEILVSFIEEHPQLTTKRASPHDSGELLELWNEVISKMEECPNGPKDKDLSEWKKTWKDLKRYVREKITNEINKEKGEEVNVSHFLTPLEIRILRIMQWQDGKKVYDPKAVKEDILNRESTEMNEPDFNITLPTMHDRPPRPRKNKKTDHGLGNTDLNWSVERYLRLSLYREKQRLLEKEEKRKREIELNSKMIEFMNSCIETNVAMTQALKEITASLKRNDDL